MLSTIESTLLISTLATDHVEPRPLTTVEVLSVSGGSSTPNLDAQALLQGVAAHSGSNGTTCPNS